MLYRYTVAYQTNWYPAALVGLITIETTSSIFVSVWLYLMALGMGIFSFAIAWIEFLVVSGTQ